MRQGSFQLDRDSKAFELAQLLVRLFRSLDSIVGGDAQSLQSWMISANLALGRKPVELIRPCAVSWQRWIMSILAEPSSKIHPFTGEIWRMVESQSRASTLPLTDTLEEQALLEQLIEEVKPAFPPDCAGLHYLLATPFRYAPYPHGSRFRRAGQREGVFTARAASRRRRLNSPSTACCSSRNRPIRHCPRAGAVEHTAFSVRVRGGAADLTKPPFNEERGAQGESHRLCRLPGVGRPGPGRWRRDPDLSLGT